MSEDSKQIDDDQLDDYDTLQIDDGDTPEDPPEKSAEPEFTEEVASEGDAFDPRDEPFEGLNDGHDEESLDPREGAATEPASEEIIPDKRRPARKSQAPYSKILNTKFMLGAGLTAAALIVVSMFYMDGQSPVPQPENAMSIGDQLSGTPMPSDASENPNYDPMLADEFCNPDQPQMIDEFLCRDMGIDINNLMATQAQPSQVSVATDQEPTSPPSQQEIDDEMAMLMDGLGSNVEKTPLSANEIPAEPGIEMPAAPEMPPVKTAVEPPAQTQLAPPTQKSIADVQRITLLEDELRQAKAELDGARAALQEAKKGNTPQTEGKLVDENKELKRKIQLYIEENGRFKTKIARLESGRDTSSQSDSASKLDGGGSIAGWSLKGITGNAAVFESRNGDSYIVREGEVVDGFRILNIDTDDLTVETSGGTLALR